MSLRNDIVYRYDGSYDGFLCCVFRAIYEKELPCEISTFEEASPSLFTEIEIETDTEKALRVENSLIALGKKEKALVSDCFASCLPCKESALLAFLRFAYQQPHAADRLTHPIVAPLLKAQHFLHHECHLFQEFIRFSSRNGALVSIIEPKNFILPYIQSHFCKRYPQEYFLIWDQTHRFALLHTPQREGIFPLERFTPPEVTQEERDIRTLWKTFYDSVAIAARTNPRCRMNHMPKRFWAHLPELCPEDAYESPCQRASTVVPAPETETRSSSPAALYHSRSEAETNGKTNILNHLDALHTTEKGLQRITEHLQIPIEDFHKWVVSLVCSPDATFERQEKNSYVTAHGICLTIQNKNFTVITAHRQKKIPY